jgi:O-Antigen ligase
MSTVYSVPQQMNGAALDALAAGREARRWGVAMLAVVVLTWAAAPVIGLELTLRTLAFVGLGGLALGLIFPTVGVLSVGLLCVLDAPMRVYVLTGGLLRWNTFSYILCVVLLIGAPRLLRRNDAQTRLLQLLLVVMGIGLLISPDAAAGVERMLNVVGTLGMLVYMWAVDSDETSWYWLGLVCGVAGAAGGLAFYASLGGNKLILATGSLDYINPNSWSYLPLGAMFALCLGFRAAQRERFGEFAFQLLTLVNIAWVFLSGSRGNLLVAIMCALFVLAMTRGGTARLRTIVGAVLILVAAAAQFSMLASHTTTRLQETFDPSISITHRSSGRSDIVRGGLHMFLTHPVGVGTGGFTASWSQPGGGAEVSRVYGYSEPVQAHSGWLAILVENGIPGLLALAAFILSFAVTGLHRHDRFLRLLGLLVAVSLALAFLSTEFAGKCFWFMAAGAMALLHAPRAGGGRPAQRT